MEAREREILEALDAAVHEQGALERIAEIVQRVERALEGDPEAQLAWEPIPLDAYASLPEGMRSSWVFLLRAGSVTGAERHPNSHQRMMSYRGSGDFQTRPAGEWESHLLRSDPDAPLEERWISIPPGVWHQGVVPDRDWVVVSFQTASVDELIEERPDAANEELVHRRTYTGRSTG